MTHSPGCPLCGGALDRPMQIDVCGACYQDLRAAGSTDLATTAEFKAVSPERAEGLLRGPRPRPRSLSAEGVACTWCGKARDQVVKILSSGSAHICNECVALCSDILSAELGDTWR